MMQEKVSLGELGTDAFGDAFVTLLEVRPREDGHRLPLQEALCEKDTHFLAEGDFY